jgi:16S rRNA (guanine966-N2)-methyltransferase
MIREALFSMLGSVEDAGVLDLFAGSGALGIEALSRGAASATFVDSDVSAVRAVRENLARLGIGQARVLEVEAHATVARAGVPVFLRAAARNGKRWSLVFCDPPYRLAHRLTGQLEELLPPVLAEEARIVCESSVKQPLKLDIPLLKERSYRDTLIAIHGYTKPAEGPSGKR